MIRLLSCSAALVIMAACGGSDFTSDGGSSGGASGAAGSSTAGSSTAGSSSSSGGSTSGGDAGRGGTTPGSGGVVSSGGNLASGGSTSVAGGTSVGGSMGTAGGMTGGGSSGPNCEMLVADYLAKANATRDCNPAGSDTQCNHDWTMVGPCGCDVYFSGVSSNEEFDARDAAYDDLQNANCEIPDCGYCPVLSNMPACLLEEGSLDRYVCRDP